VSAVRFRPRPPTYERPPPPTLLRLSFDGNVETLERSAACASWSQQFLSQALNGETIALEQIDDAIWNILYYDTLLGRYDERNTRITGVPALRGKC